MAIWDFLFKGRIDEEVSRRITEVETRMAEVSEQKAAEKAQELHNQWIDDLNKAQKDAYDAEAKSLLHDPFQLLETLKYKERPMMLTYEVLRAMSERNPIVAAVINTRVNQVSSFSTPPMTPYDIGFRVHMRDDEMKPTTEDEERIKEIEGMMEQTGVISVVPGEERDDLDVFLRKITRDTLTYDQMAFEVVNGRGGDPVAFLAIDAATVRLASTAKYFRDIKYMKGFIPPPVIETQMGSIQKKQVRPEDIKYVQIIDGKVVTTYTEQELGFGIRNPRTAIKQNGYGVSELEILVNTVTSHLWAEEYNRRFFCASLFNMLDARVKVNSTLCREGAYLLKDLISKDFEVWNGKEYVKARAFETGIRPKVRTKLWNGIELETSPEHRFLVIPKNSVSGEPEWKEQKDLQSGDFALLSKKEQTSPMDYELLKVGKKYTVIQKDEDVRSYEKKLKNGRMIRVEGFSRKPKHDQSLDHWSPSKEMVDDPEFWEMIGFALGDGYWSDWLAVYPNPTRESDILKRFELVCNKYSDIHGEVRISNPLSIRKSDGGQGYPYVVVLNDGVLTWLYDIGFSKSTNRKKNRRIPMVFYQLPSWIRCALLRGLFSADGMNEGYSWAGTPKVASRCYKFRQNILRCLWSVGVAANEQGKGWERRDAPIIVQDIQAFASKIGFLQTQPNSLKSKANLVRSQSSKNRWDKLHPVLSQKLAQQIMAHSNYSCSGNNQYRKDRERKLSKQDMWMVTGAVKGSSRLSRPRAIEIMNKLGIKVPWWLEAFVQVPIDILDKKPIGYELMGDVEVFDNKHIFLCNGVAVHNSQGSAPKGIIHFEGNIPQDQLTAFRRQWHAQVMGVFNAWRTPIIAAPAKLQYTNLQMSNRQMEFSNWIDYLIKLVCAVYLIDPAEIGFEMRGGAAGAQPPAFETHHEARQKMSRDRGLRPLLKFIQSEVNKNVVYRLYGGRYEFEFVGLDVKTEEQLQEMHLKEIQNFKTIDEVRAEYDLELLGHDKGGDVIMNSAYLSYLNQLQMQKMQTAGAPGEAAPGEDFGREEGVVEPMDFGEEVEMGGED